MKDAQRSVHKLLAYFSSYSHKNVVMMFNPVPDDDENSLFPRWKEEKFFYVIALKLFHTWRVWDGKILFPGDEFSS